MKIEPIEQALEIHRSDRIIALAHDLYSHFFFFLAHTLNFFEASLIKRTFTCLNQSLVTDLKQEAQLVADIALCIFQHFQVAHMQFERNSTLSQRSQAVDVRVIFVGNLQEGWDTRWTDESANNLLRLLKGQHQSEIWRLEAAPADGEDEQVSNRRVASQAAAKTPENASQSTEKKEDRLSDRHADRHTCDDLLKRTASLELQIQYSPMKVMAIIEDNTAYTQWDSWAAIESWTASPQSRALGIAKEEYEEAYPSSLSPLASSMVESAMKLKIPVIAYFCGWPSDDYNGEDKATREKRCFLDMILCLLRSLICVLPEEFEADFDLSDSRIQKMCDGSPENLVEALSLFEDLLDLAPSTLFIILDGIDHLEFTSVEENLKNLVKLLLKRLAAEDPSRSTHTAKAIKLLVTTAASALSLEELESPWVDVVTESSYMGRKGRYYTERQEWGI